MEISNNSTNISPYPELLTKKNNDTADSKENVNNQTISYGSEVTLESIVNLAKTSELKNVFTKVDNVRTVLQSLGFDCDKANPQANNISRKVEYLAESYRQFSDKVSFSSNYSAQHNSIDLASYALRDIRQEIANNNKAATYNLVSMSSTKIEAEADNELTTSTSYAELWAVVYSAIGDIKTNYVDFYADLLQKYTELYEAFNDYVQKYSSDAVSAGDDSNTVRFDTSKMQEGYNKFQEKVDQLNSELGSVPGWSSMSDVQQQSMTSTLEPAFHVDDNGKITFNLDQYNDSVKDTLPSTKDGKVSTPAYQAWLATFNAAGSALQSNMQSFAQRYSQANSTYDNINKILSSTISGLGDAAKDVLKALI